MRYQITHKHSPRVYKGSQPQFYTERKMKTFEIYKINREEFQLPYHEFNHMDRIAIKKIIIEWKLAPHKVFGILTTDLISGFSENRRNQLCSFVKLPKTTVTEVEFNDPLFYEVQTSFLQNSKFNIESMFGEEIPEIKNFE